MIATASVDKTATLLDFTTGKVLYTGAAADGGEMHLIKINSHCQILGYLYSVCFI